MRKEKQQYHIKVTIDGMVLASNLQEAKETAESLVINCIEGAIKRVSSESCNYDKDAERLNMEEDEYMCKDGCSNHNGSICMCKGYCGCNR